MIKALFGIVVGMFLAFALGEWMEKTWARYRPQAVTGTLLDKVNRRLEENRGPIARSGSTRRPVDARPSL
jgi:membrane protein DedA with SNARE-associated domain